jgi:GntR family transcriptional regulator
MPIPTGLIPRYYALKETLAARLRAGEFPPGTRFPTDEALCLTYHLSRGTVRRAVDLLVDDGRLRREQGRGTFVIAPQLAPVSFRLTDFGEDMQQQGLISSTRLLRLRTLPADSEIAAHLDLKLGEPVIEIHRLRLANAQPMALETRYMSYNICPSILNEDLENQSVHRLLIEKFNIPLIRACHTIEARLLSAGEANLLAVAPGTAGFLVDRVTYTNANRAVTWLRTVYRGDQYRFVAEFQQFPQP